MSEFLPDIFCTPLSSLLARVRVRVAHRDYWFSEIRPQEWLLIVSSDIRNWSPGDTKMTPR